MRIMITDNSKLRIRFIAAFTAVICSFVMLRGICAKCFDDSENTIKVLAYTSIGNSKGMATAQQVENDIIYLNNKGYSPVFLSELADCINTGNDLPQKAVVLTFDGGYAQYYTEIFPLLKKYRFKADITVLGEMTEYASNSADDNAAFLRWDEIREMEDSGVVEFSNGTYSMWDSVEFEQKSGEDYEQYRSRIVNDIDRVQMLFQQNCGFEPNIFTYPNGKASDYSARVVKNLGFKAAAELGNRSVRLKGKNKTDTYRIQRYDRSEIKDISDFFG